MPRARLAADVGGTFTDIAVEHDGGLATTKVLTTPRAPEKGVLAGIERALAATGLAPDAFELVIHGTTLATNAIIERRGAKTALLVTEGFRDVVEMAFENRFEQYDIYMDRPEPLVPRHLRIGVKERIDANGNMLIPLDTGALDPVVRTLKEEGIEAVAIGFIHAYVDGRHERAVRDRLSREMPGLSITLSSEVSPEIREYERWSTAAANAYVQPLMAGYIARLEEALNALGFACPLYLMTSGGGLARPETGRRFPIRLVESGPAGGAILAAHISRQCGLDRVLSFDMGGTTAKICLIDDGEPQASRSFEVAREYRFLKGSGLPLRIPVIEMVEIGAGGGSIARVDAMKRLAVGPESAGADPGPACYSRGGTEATVTDADVTLGWIDPDGFAGGTIPLDPRAAEQAIAAGPGATLGLAARDGAHGIAEVVVENMANAARVHAVERGKTLGDRTLIAFGGAAPVHAARLAEKLGIERILIPGAAGVGSAVGFLRAPVAYEVVGSLYAALDETFDPAAINALLDRMREEADGIVAAAAPGAALGRTLAADMRYRGQGHELAVALPDEPLDPASRGALIEAFEAAYARTYSRTIPGLVIEAMNWTLRVAAETDPPERCPPMPEAVDAKSATERAMCDPATAGMAEAPVFLRGDLAPGMTVAGPAVIAEDETTTIVLDSFAASIDALGNIRIAREPR